MPPNLLLVLHFFNSLARVRNSFIFIVNWLSLVLLFVSVFETELLTVFRCEFRLHCVIFRLPLMLGQMCGEQFIEFSIKCSRFWWWCWQHWPRTIPDRPPGGWGDDGGSEERCCCCWADDGGMNAIARRWQRTVMFWAMSGRDSLRFLLWLWIVRSPSSVTPWHVLFPFGHQHPIDWWQRPLQPPVELRIGHVFACGAWSCPVDRPRTDTADICTVFHLFNGKLIVVEICLLA